jgi:hypothetical protein
MGLPGRLNVLSSNLNNLLIGSVWHPPFFLDGYAKDYAQDLKNARLTAALILKVV